MASVDTGSDRTSGSLRSIGRSDASNSKDDGGADALPSSRDSHTMCLRRASGRPQRRPEAQLLRDRLALQTKGGARD
jgi:hypothetical protein